MKKQSGAALWLRLQLLFSGSCVEMQERSSSWAVNDSWKATRVWCTGHWLLQLLSGAMHTGTAGRGCPPLVEDGGMEQVKRRRRRSETEKERDGAWKVAQWLGVKVLQPLIWSFFKSLFQRCRRSGCATGFRVCACVFSFQERRQVCSIGLACAFRLWVWVCVFTCPHIRA